MTIQVEPELGVPVPAKKTRMDAKKRIAAAAATAEELEQYGLDLEPNKEDQDIAAKITVAYADDPEKTSKQVTESRTVLDPNCPGIGMNRPSPSFRSSEKQ